MLLWTDPGLKSGISVRDLKLVVEHSPKILAREEKATTTTTTTPRCTSGYQHMLQYNKNRRSREPFKMSGHGELGDQKRNLGRAKMATACINFVVCLHSCASLSVSVTLATSPHDNLLGMIHTRDLWAHLHRSTEAALCCHLYRLELVIGWNGDQAS